MHQHTCINWAPVTHSGKNFKNYLLHGLKNLETHLIVRKSKGKESNCVRSRPWVRSQPELGSEMLRKRQQQETTTKTQYQNKTKRLRSWQVSVSLINSCRAYRDPLYVLVAACSPIQDRYFLQYSQRLSQNFTLALTHMYCTIASRAVDIFSLF